MDLEHGIEEPVSPCPEITDIAGAYSGDKDRLRLILQVNGTFDFAHNLDFAHNQDTFEFPIIRAISLGPWEIVSKGSSCFVQLITDIAKTTLGAGPGEGIGFLFAMAQIEGSGTNVELRFSTGVVPLEPQGPVIILQRVINSPGEPLDT
jgi:hypothetical protein